MTRPRLILLTPVLAAALAACQGAAPAATAAQSPASAGVLPAVSGHGDADTPAFTTGPDWSVSLTFTCPAGTLRVTRDDPGRGGLPLLDATGRGTVTVHVHDSRGPHVLHVAAACAWTLSVANGGA